MQVCRKSSTNVDKLSYALHTRSLVEVPGGNCLSNNIEIGASRVHFHLLHFHNVLQLLPNLPGFPEELGVQEVTQGPFIAVSNNRKLVARYAQGEVELTRDSSIGHRHSEA